MVLLDQNEIFAAKSVIRKRSVTIEKQSKNQRLETRRDSEVDSKIQRGNATREICLETIVTQGYKQQSSRRFDDDATIHHNKMENPAKKNDWKRSKQLQECHLSNKDINAQLDS